RRSLRIFGGSAQRSVRRHRKKGHHVDDPASVVCRMAEVIRKPERILDRAKQRIVVVGSGIGHVTWTMIGYDNGRDPPAARIVGRLWTEPATAVGMRRQLVVVVFVECD